MELREAIMKRRSYRAFTDEPVTREQIDAVIEAGLWAPSGMASQSAIVVELADASPNRASPAVRSSCRHR